MSKSKSIALATVAVGAIFGFSAASAADMAVKARPLAVDSAYNWNGWYVGANAGGAWGNPTGNLNSFSTAPPAIDFTAAVTAGATPRSLGANHEGYFGGGQIGYNWQSRNWVFGIETDIQGADIGRASSITFGGGGGIVPSVSTGRDHLDWFGTLRGRVGLAAQNLLFYGTGGLAYGGVQTSATNIFTPGTSGTFLGSTSGTQAGWVAGAGIEWGFAPKWTLKGEYLHIDLGSSTVNVLDPVNFPGAFAAYRFHHELDTLRVGINYRFGGAIPAKY